MAIRSHSETSMIFSVFLETWGAKWYTCGSDMFSSCIFGMQLCKA